MRASKNEAAVSRTRILSGASRLLRERGIEGTTIVAVMDAAGLTHGGFYRHFESKEAVVAQAIEAAFAEMIATFVTASKGASPEEALLRYREHYLSDAYAISDSFDCPMATLAPEVARGSDDLRARFGAGLATVVDMMASIFPGNKRQRQDRSMVTLAAMVGAVVLARAVDQPMARRVLEAARSEAPRQPDG